MNTPKEPTWIVGRKGEKIAFKDMPVDLACEILKLIDEYDREHTELKTISRSRECVEAECNVMCSLIDYEDFKPIFKDNPRMCPNYRKGKSEDAEWKESEPLDDVVELMERSRNDHYNIRQG